MTVPLSGFPRPGPRYDFQNEAQFRAAVDAAIAALDAAIAEGIEVIASDLTFDGNQTFDGTVTFNGAVTAGAVAIDFSSATSFTFPAASVTEAMVTQHEAALTILESQITDGSILARLAANETVAGSWTFSLAPSFPVGTITEAMVTQHEAALGIAWSQITATPTTVAGYGITDAMTPSYSGNITGAWDFTATDGLSVSGAALAPTATGSQLLVRDQNDGNAVKYLNAPTANSSTYFLRYNSSAGGFTWGTTVPAPDALTDVGDVNGATVAGNDFLQWTGSQWEGVTIGPGDLGSTLGSSAFLKVTPGAPPTMDWAGITEADITDLQSYLLPSYSGNITGAFDFTATDGLSVSGAALAGSGTDLQLLVRDPSDGNAVKRLLPPTLTSTNLYLRYLSSVGFNWVELDGTLDAATLDGLDSTDFFDLTRSDWSGTLGQDHLAESTATQTGQVLKITLTGPFRATWAVLTESDISDLGNYIEASYTGNLTGAVDFTATDGLSVTGAAIAPTATGSQILVRDQNDGNAVKYLNAPTADSSTYYLRYNSATGGFTWVSAIPVSGDLGDLDDVNATGQASGNFLQYSGSAWVPVDIDPGDLGATLGSAAFLKLTPGGPPTMDWVTLDGSDITSGVVGPDYLAPNRYGETPYRNIVQFDRLASGYDLNNITEPGFYGLHSTHTNGPSTGSSYDPMLVMTSPTDVGVQIVFPRLSNSGVPKYRGFVSSGATWYGWKTLAVLEEDQTFTGLVRFEGGLLVSQASLTVDPEFPGLWLEPNPRDLSPPTGGWARIVGWRNGPGATNAAAIGTYGGGDSINYVFIAPTAGNGDTGFNDTNNFRVYPTGNVLVQGTTNTDRIILNDDGTAVSAALCFAGDGNTGLYQPATEELAVTIDGTMHTLFDQEGLKLQTGFVFEGVGDPSPEAGAFILPYLTNDLGHLTKRGGSWSQNTANATSAELDRLLDGTADTVTIYDTDTFPYTITLDLGSGNNLTYSTWVGFSFGSEGFSNKYVKIEAYSEGTWKTLIDRTNNSQATLWASVPSNSATGVTKIRVTFSQFDNNSSGNYFRLNHLFAWNYKSGLGTQLYLNRRGGDTIYGDLTLEGALNYGTYISGPTTSSRTKIRVYGTSTNYAIGMQSGVTYGALNNDWAMTFQMNSDSDRGFWWGDTAHTAAQGAMSLTTDGRLTVARNIQVGVGEGNTSLMHPTWELYVNGDARVSATFRSDGEITAAGGLDLPSGEIFTVNGGTGAITNSRSHDYRPIVVRQSGGTRPTMDDGTILMEYD